MRQEGLHPRVLKEQTKVTVMLFYIILDRSSV